MADYNLSSALPSPFPKIKVKEMEKHQQPVPKITLTEDVCYKKKVKIRKVKGRDADSILLLRPRNTFGKSSSLPSSFLPLSITKNALFSSIWRGQGEIREKRRTLFFCCDIAYILLISPLFLHFSCPFFVPQMLRFLCCGKDEGKEEDLVGMNPTRS